MGVREGLLAGVPVRLLRVGFVGELGYEIHVPAGFGEALWDTLVEAGRPLGLGPVGLEAQRLLRLEKGHVIVGQDTDGLTTPREADMVWAIGKNKAFFLGKRALAIQAKRPLERKLVGFTLASEETLPAESQLVVRNGDIVGRVTSVARSRACGCIVGMAYVHPDQARPGCRFQIKLGDGRLLPATVTPMPFYDPGNARQEL
jgi:sarcosine oxidase subunit alpha